MKRKLLFSFVVAQIFATSMFAQSTTQAEGAGQSEINPFIIASAEDLLAMNSVYSSTAPSTAELRYFKMTADVDMAGNTWTPFNIGTNYNQQLQFDGNGHVIKNLAITSASNYTGFVGVLCGRIKNLGIVNANFTITAGSSHGIIAAYCGLANPNSIGQIGIIENCYTTGKIISTGTGSVRIGGITGYMGGEYGANLPTVKNCYSTATVKGASTTVASIVGCGYTGKKGLIENCYSAGTITNVGGYIGGMIGYQKTGYTTIQGCVSRNDSIICTAATENILTRRIGGSMGASTITNNLASATTIVQTSAIPTYLASFYEDAIVSNGYDGVTTAESLLNQQSTYENIGWDFNSIWSPTFHNVYPMLQWLAARPDYKQISGFTSSADASLSDLKFKGTTINNFSTGTYSYDVKLPVGSAVPTVEDILASKTHANATYELTRSSAVFPTTITVVVTAEDEVTTQSYVINFTEDATTNLQDARLNFSIASYDGNLIISEVLNKNISVYSCTGQLIYSMNAAVNTVQMPLNKGVYLVRVNENTSKVIVK